MTAVLEAGGVDSMGPSDTRGARASPLRVQCYPHGMPGTAWGGDSGGPLRSLMLPEQRALILHLTPRVLLLPPLLGHLPPDPTQRSKSKFSSYGTSLGDNQLALYLADLKQV